MMKFLRKHNKKILAVLGAVLLVTWLLGDSLTSLLRSDERQMVLGHAVTGQITVLDRQRAEYTSGLQELVRLSWRSWNGPNASPDEALEFTDWVLLTREARRYGVSVSPAEAQRLLAARQLPEEIINQIAVKRDVTPETIYAAAAEFFTVTKLLGMFQSVAGVPEAQLRGLARDALEQAVVEMVVLPAESFADPAQTFSDDQVQAQFDAAKDKRRGDGRMDFGYFVEPKVKLQYICIDPAAIQEGLQRSDAYLATQALNFWKENRQKDKRFQRPAENAGTNGAAPPTTQPTYFATFEEAQAIAVDAVKTDEARAEADRIAQKLQRLLNEPWLHVNPAANGYKPAPSAVAQPGHYADVIAQLPANLRYPNGVTVNTPDKAMTAEQVSTLEGIGATSLTLAQGGSLPFASLALNVEGLAEIPQDERVEQSLYLSLWQTSSAVLTDHLGRLYLFRVVAAQPSHVPTGLDEVRDEVLADLRLVAGLQRAHEAAETFAATARELGLKPAWDADQQLANRVTPNKGGYIPDEAFPRDQATFMPMLPPRLVPSLGSVDEGFMELAFRLAAQGPASEVAVTDVKNAAKVVVLKGRELKPLYQEQYDRQRTFLERRLVESANRELLARWLNARQIRERNQFTVPRRG